MKAAMTTITDDEDEERIRPVILSGGSGTRLWPLSTPARPKQFLTLVGQTSLLHETFARLADPVLFGAPTVICGKGHVEQVLAEARSARAGQVRIVAEPCGRNTAAAIALAALTARSNELLLILPSDHHIHDAAAFRATVDVARAAAQDGIIVTFGMKPTRVETGFGYVEVGTPLVGAVCRAERFIEKPDAERARAMIETGRFLWNGGIFLATAATLVAAFEQCAPDIIDAVRPTLANPLASRVEPDPVEFAAVPSIAFDHAVMEKFDRVGVICSDFGWSDVGSWIAAYENAEHDTAGNAFEPGSAVIGGTGNLLRSSGPRIVALGVEGLMVLATDDVVLVAPLADAQRIREAHDWYHESSCN
jgi:mannose-1-phosphate guanylyltransferase/mannose-6-phosphate isomerase